MKGPDMSRLSSLKKVPTVDGVNKQALNVRNAILTPKGTRPNLPEYGSNLHLLQFALITQPNIDLMHYYINQAIIDSIPDVTLEALTYQVDVTRRRCNIQIQFRDSTSGKLGNTSVEFNDGKFS